MRVNIKNGSVTITDAMRETFTQKVEKRLKKFPELHDSETTVTCYVEPNGDHKVKVITIDNSYYVREFVAEETSKDMYIALDVAVAKIVRQVIRQKEHFDKQGGVALKHTFADEEYERTEYNPSREV